MDIKKILIIFLMLASNSLYAGATEWLKMDVENGHILIDVEVKGIATKALLDTGAEGMAISEGFLEKNNIPYLQGRKFISQGVYGEKEKHFVKKMDVNLYGTEITLNDLMPIEGEHKFGIIFGMPFFRQFIIQIDYPQSRYRLITRGSIDMKALANVNLKQGNDKRYLVVRSKIEGKEKIDLLFDTGNSGGIVLERHFAAKRGWLEKYSKGLSLHSGVIETVENENLVIPSLEFGPYNIADVQIIVPGKDTATNITRAKQRPITGQRIAQGTAYEGILGYDILKNFIVTLDAKAAHLHIIAP